MRIQQFDYVVDLLQALVWQYNKSTHIVGLIQKKQAWYSINQSKFWKDWFDDTFNLLTADNFGLSVWSKILDVPYYVADVNPENVEVFGFNAFVGESTTEMDNSNQNFEQGNFAHEEPAIVLTTEEQRFFLRLIFFKYSTRAAVTGVNEFLDYLVSTSDIGYSGKIYALDGLDMSMTYVFSFPTFSESLLQAIKDNDAFPRPTGVLIDYYLETDSFFGFGEDNQNFNNGNFAPDED